MKTVMLLSSSRTFSLSNPMKNGAVELELALEIFHCVHPTFHLRLPRKRLQNASNLLATMCRAKEGHTIHCALSSKTNV